MDKATAESGSAQFTGLIGFPIHGIKATGSPWWFDSLNVNDGESYDIAFVADNPGIWMDHRHNLTHAAQGLVAHLMYDGISTPYTIGGTPANRPE